MQLILVRNELTCESNVKLVQQCLLTICLSIKQSLIYQLEPVDIIYINTTHQFCVGIHMSKLEKDIYRPLMKL